MKKTKPIYSFKALCAIASKEAHHLALQCLRFEPDGTVTATDSYAMVTTQARKFGVDVQLEKPVSIPASMLKSINVTHITHAPESEEEVLVMDDKQNVYRLKASDEDYPDYKQIVPTQEKMRHSMDGYNDRMLLNPKLLSRLLAVFGDRVMAFQQLDDMLIITEGYDSNEPVGFQMKCRK